MSWLAFVLAGNGVSPVATATGDIVTYILSFGVLGVGVILYQLGLIVPKSTVNSAVNAARADLVAELERVRAEKAHAEEQRDEALKTAQTTLIPLLGSFTASTASLLPLLQEMVHYREDRGDDHRPGRR